MRRLTAILLIFSITSPSIYASRTDEPYPFDKLNYLYSSQNAVPPKHLHPRVSLIYWYYSASEQYNEDGNRYDMDFDGKYTQNWIVPSFSFGAGDVAEFGVAIPIIREDLSFSEVINKKFAGSGVSDILIWTNVAVTKKPWFGFRFAAKLAVGNDDYNIEEEMPVGSGQTDIDLGWQFSYAPEKMGFLCDASIGYRIRLSKEIDWAIEEPGPYEKYDPGEEGRLGLYLGGMPVEGFGILFGGDGFVTFNDQYDGDEIKKSYRASSLIGLKMFYKAPFGLKVSGGFKTDIAGKDAPAGFGLNFGVSYEPEF